MSLKINDLTIPIWIYDIDNHCIRWANQPALTLWESDSTEELYSRDFKSVTSKAVESRLLEYQRAFKKDNAVFYENWHFVPKGISKFVFCQFSRYTFEDDGRIAMLVSGLQSSKLDHSMQINLTAMLSDYSTDGNFISGNPPFVNAIGHKISNLQDLIVNPYTLKTIYRSLSQSGRFEDDVLVSGSRGERWYHSVVVKVHDDDEEEKILIHQYDIHRRKMNEVALSKEVLTDALTGLLNRRGLDKKLVELKHSKQSFLLYYIDLDGFKTINDSFGHGIGDQVLQTVADRLLIVLPANSSICRYGGDEFVAIVQVRHLETDKAVLAGAIVKSLSDAYYDDSRSMALSASIGLAQYPNDVDKVSNIICCADIAMYQAKRLGKRQWINYSAGMEKITLRQSEITQKLSYAQSNKELQLYYQPVWEISKSSEKKIISFEALLRWHSGDLGIIPAEEIMPVLEELGILIDVEKWVVEQALSDLLVLRECLDAKITVAVNLSAMHLREATLPDFLLAALAQKNLLPRDLTIELSEIALVEEVNDDSSTVVYQLVESGFNISIDNFGTGYSSLAYLHRIPAIVVKVDHSFVSQIEPCSKTLTHIQGLIEAHGMQVLALGVDTEKHKEALTRFGIYLHQGQYWGCPQPISYYNKKSYSSL
ncbi:MAG: diguanylate cyclase (GGDEF)-like protein [Pseudohongiellaceae bacterium]|jgi:diguanylate cyclase (GGDEF)-like protein